MPENKGSISRRKFLLGGVALGVAAAAGIGIAERKNEQPLEQTLPERIKSFGWEEAKNPQDLSAFTDALGDEYLRLTHSPRVTKNDLTDSGKLALTATNQEFLQLIHDVNPIYPTTQGQWGYTDYAIRKVFVDLETLQAQNQTNAGQSIAHALWDQWGYLDVTKRDTGKLINNPHFSIESPVSKENEAFRYYRGAEVYTNTYSGYDRVDGVVNETITLRRLIEQVGLDNIVVAGDYYRNGTDFFVKFTDTFIELNTLYQLHATSDFEQLATLVGQKLPGSENPLIKGIALFNGIQLSDKQLIQETGVFSVLPQSQ